MYFDIHDDNFYSFRSEIQHRIKRDAYRFVLDIIESDLITFYYNQSDYTRCLYLLSCVDTICEENNLPLCSDYDKFRQMRLKKPLYVGRRKTNDKYLPMFEKHNIYEVTIHDAC